VTGLVSVGEIATHQPSETLRDGKADSDRSGLAWLVLGPLIRFENPFLIFCRDGIAVVLYDYRDERIAQCAHFDAYVVTAVALGVGDEVAEDLANPSRISYGFWRVSQNGDRLALIECLQDLGRLGA
jgi:hypothetical protein